MKLLEMFQQSARKAIAVEPVAVAITVRSDEDNATLSEHAAIAKKVGAFSDAGEELERRRFEIQLREWGYRLYDRQQVAAFLTAQYGPPKNDRFEAPRPSWGWRPLRESDRNMGGDWGIRSLRNDVIQTTLPQYQKPVPIPVLLTVERVAEQFPEALFYVSDEIFSHELVRDPFLLVELHDKHYIIERWDEPNYRER